MSKDERLALQRLVREGRCRGEVRRSLAILRLADGYSVSEVARLVEAARSSVYRWLEAFRRDGVGGLRQGRRGRGRWTVNRFLIEALVWLLGRAPEEFGYLRSTWSSELMAKALAEQFSLYAHPSTLRRLLPRIEWAWRRARPTLNRRDPNKAEKLARIEAALADDDARTEVFYVDEADIDLNPRIGYQWTRRGEQPAIVTPGQNHKAYLAGALHAHTRQVLWRGGEGKNSALFIELLEHLRSRYRVARRIVLILDNYIIHKSRETERWLAKNPKFELLFQPVYHPWVNRIERLWKAMHDTVTRNHRCPTMEQLIERVVRFLDVVRPFPGAGHGLARADAGVAPFGAAICLCPRRPGPRTRRRQTGAGSHSHPDALAQRVLPGVRYRPQPLFALRHFGGSLSSSTCGWWPSSSSNLRLAPLALPHPCDTDGGRCHRTSAHSQAAEMPLVARPARQPECPDRCSVAP